MTLSEDLRRAIEHRFGAEDVKLSADNASGSEEVHAYGMLPDSTIMGWYSLGDLDELEKELREKGEL